MRDFSYLIQNDTIYANPSYLTIVRNVYNPDKVQQLTTQYVNNFKTNRTQGIISTHAAKNIKRCIDWFYLNTPQKQYTKSGTQEKIKYKLCFLTLTLPAKQKHDDNYIKKYMLSQFLDDIKTKYQCNDYFWRAERQQNGNIHFHIIIDKFLHWFIIRTLWNRLCKKEGYIQDYQQSQTTKYKNGFFCNEYAPGTDNYKIAENRYLKGVSENWTNPNSTDIKAIDNIKKCKAYISKYLVKNSYEYRPDEVAEGIIKPIIGRLWFCSEKYLKIKSIVSDNFDKLYANLRTIYTQFADKIIENDFFDVICIGFNEFKKYGLYDLFNWFESERKLLFTS